MLCCWCLCCVLDLQDWVVVLVAVVVIAVVIAAVAQCFDLVDSVDAMTEDLVDCYLLPPTVDNGDAPIVASLSRAASFNLNQTECWLLMGLD